MLFNWWCVYLVWLLEYLIKKLPIPVLIFKISNNLPQSITNLRNEKPQFKVALKVFLYAYEEIRDPSTTHGRAITSFLVTQRRSVNSSRIMQCIVTLLFVCILTIENQFWPINFGYLPSGRAIFTRATMWEPVVIFRSQKWKKVTEVLQCKKLLWRSTGQGMR